MILDSVTLENFCAYRGTQEITLTPIEGKPIILLGAMNGGGKTTILDAIQLAFFGQKAKVSNRGRLAYRTYLRECIHRNSDPQEGASIKIVFRRMSEGVFNSFEIHRHWRVTSNDLEERVIVSKNGFIDPVLTEHWDEYIEGFLPCGVSHLFFFDGEQVKELAEGSNAAEILGTAIHSLLGLDIVDRLEMDLKSLERQKKADSISDEGIRSIKIIKDEIQALDSEQESVASHEGRLVNECGRLAKLLNEREEAFRKEGGELYLSRSDIIKECNVLKNQKTNAESSLRDLVTGEFPFFILQELIQDVEIQSAVETDIRKAKLVINTLIKRDQIVIDKLRQENVPNTSIMKISNALDADRHEQEALSKKPLILDGDDSLEHHIKHFRTTILPNRIKDIRILLQSIEILSEKLLRHENEIIRIPAEDKMLELIKDLDDAKKQFNEKNLELESIQLRKSLLAKQRIMLEDKFIRVSEEHIDDSLADDNKKRILKHSQKVRITLDKFRVKVISRHISKMESLILEAFQRLLRKSDFVQNLTINPTSFEPTLSGRSGNILPIDRLSAGERQILATSMLWGVARASGKPMPTIIDTPLGRLDSSHRKHLVERYFPYASHQVILLSTDEEIEGKYLEALKPYIARSYLLQHSDKEQRTNIMPGYFS